MITALYAALCAFLIVWLSLNVIKKRREHKVSLGDGGHSDLGNAVAAQAHAIEYIPIALILLFALEYNGASALVLHGLGLLLVTGRVLHGLGMSADDMKNRVMGMQLTLWTILLLAGINLAYLPFDKLF